MIDRELLELAARAAGIGLFDDEHGETWRVYYTDPNNGLKRYTRWNPLTNDGDALRLAVTLHLTVCVGLSGSTTVTDAFRNPLAVIQHDNDPDATTRRVIVRAAAEIGRSMK